MKTKMSVSSVNTLLSTETDFNVLKVAELRVELKKRGLTVKGNKSELIKRLTVNDSFDKSDKPLSADNSPQSNQDAIIDNNFDRPSSCNNSFADNQTSPYQSPEHSDKTSDKPRSEENVITDDNLTRPLIDILTDAQLSLSLCTTTDKEDSNAFNNNGRTEVAGFSVDDEFDYEICIESEDYPIIKIEPAIDPPIVVDRIIKAEPVEDNNVAVINDNNEPSSSSTFYETDNNGSRVIVSVKSEPCASPENEKREFSSCENRDSASVVVFSGDENVSVENQNITDDDMKIIWTLPRLNARKKNEIPTVAHASASASVACSFVSPKLEPPDNDTHIYDCHTIVDKEYFPAAHYDRQVPEEECAGTSSADDREVGKSVAPYPALSVHDQPTVACLGFTQPTDNDIRAVVEQATVQKVTNVRMSTMDSEFDFDDENFAKLDQPYTDTYVTLDPYNADLNFKIDASARLIGESLSHEGFVFMLAGVRSTHGFNSGKIGFEVKMLEIIDVSNSKPEEIFSFEMRVGWSTCDSSLRLGESSGGFAYCNNGKKANTNMFTKSGPAFDVGDVLACLADFDSMQINFTLNGANVNQDGYVFKFPANFSSPDGAAFPPIFPHVCVKNVKFEINFGRCGNSWFGLPEGYSFIDQVDLGQRIPGPSPLASKQDCTVMCMIGLPGSGKTTWVRQYLQNHPNESWTLLSTNAVLDQMKVQGEPRKKKHQGRWDLMMGVVVKCLNKLILLACRMRKNYILDMTNVYPLPRRKKMTPFKDFRKKSVVLVPTVEDYANRCFQQMRHEGKQMPSDAMLEMKACFTLPKEGDEVFDETEFVELQREDAQKVVEYFNEEGKSFKPREKKRRGDWQQEELPPKHPKTTFSNNNNNNNNVHSNFPSSAVSKNHFPFTSSATSTSSISRPTSAFPYGIPSSLRTYTPSPSPVFTRQWSTSSSSAMGGTPANQNSHTVSGASWSQLRGSTNGYTPRAGWPANWPQASWNQQQQQPTTPAVQQTSAPPSTVNSQFVFPSTSGKSKSPPS